MRVDRFLAQKYTNLTRGNARMLRSGHIVVNGAQTKPSFVLRGGEHIFISERREKVDLLYQTTVFLYVLWRICVIFLWLIRRVAYRYT